MSGYLLQREKKAAKKDRGSSGKGGKKESNIFDDMANIFGDDL